MFCSFLAKMFCPKWGHGWKRIINHEARVTDEMGKPKGLNSDYLKQFTKQSTSFTSFAV